MSDELLFVLRVAATLALYLFLGVLVYLLWQDYRASATRSAAQVHARGRLVVVQAEGDVVLARNSYPLLPLTTLGRAPTNAVVIPDSFASSEHATLTLRGRRWWLEDQSSANGTTLNGRPIEAPTVVSSGDMIGVGRVLLRVELE